MNLEDSLNKHTIGLDFRKISTPQEKQSRFSPSVGERKQITVNSDSPPQKPQKLNASHKIREFEWFEVETKIRIFVSKLLEPTLKQIYEDRKIVDQVENKIATTTEQLETLHKIVLNQGSGIPIFQEFDKRILENEMKIDQDRKKQNQEIARLDREFARISFNGNQLIEECKQIEQSKSQIIEEFHELKKHNLEFRESLTKSISQLSSELTTNFQWARIEIQKTEEKFTTHDQAFDDLQSQIHRLDKRVLDLKQFAVECLVKHQENNSRFQKFEMGLGQIEDQLSITRKLQSSVLVLQNSLHTIDNFISIYQPLYIQGQISECLYSCLPHSIISKYSFYENKRLEEIHKSILNDQGEGRINVKIKEYSTFLENVTKRNSKLMQFNKIKENGENDLKSQETEQNEDEEPKKRTEIIETVNETSQQPPVKVVQNIPAIFDLLSYQDISAQIKQQLLEQNTQFQNKIDQNVKDIYKQIKEVDEQIFMNNVHAQEDIEKWQKNVQNDFQVMREQLTVAFQSINNLGQQFSDSQVRQENTHIVMHTMIRYLSLILNIFIQDEIDRQGIALHGLKENKIDDISQLPQINKGKPVIEIKSDCLSCSSSPMNTMTMFKIACLAYNPSEVIIDGKSYKRGNLLEICTKMLTQVKKEMSQISLKNSIEIKSGSKKRENASSFEIQVDINKSNNQTSRKSDNKIISQLFPTPNTSSEQSNNLDPKLSNRQAKIYMNIKNPLKNMSLERQYQRAQKNQRRIRGLDQTLWNTGSNDLQ